jgi:uncharacterized membrane protein (DUF2068 family)
MDTRKNLIAKHFGLRGVALFEAGKGVIGFAVGVWLVTLRHKDLDVVASHLLHFLHKVLHLSPDGHIARSIMHGAARVNHQNIHIWAVVAFIYTGIRFAEATGLWLEKQWAEWFALLSCTFYMYFLIKEVVRHPNVFTWGGLIINTIIVVYLAWLLRDLHKNRKPLAENAEKGTARPQESV